MEPLLELNVNVGKGGGSENCSDPGCHVCRSKYLFFHFTLHPFLRESYASLSKETWLYYGAIPSCTSRAAQLSKRRSSSQSSRRALATLRFCYMPKACSTESDHLGLLNLGYLGFVGEQEFRV